MSIFTNFTNRFKRYYRNAFNRGHISLNKPMRPKVFQPKQPKPPTYNFNDNWGLLTGFSKGLSGSNKLGVSNSTNNSMSDSFRRGFSDSFNKSMSDSFKYGLGGSSQRSSSSSYSGLTGESLANAQKVFGRLSNYIPGLTEDVINGEANQTVLDNLAELNKIATENWIRNYRPAINTAVNQAITGLANRGVLDSSVAGKILAGVSSNYLNNLADLQAQLEMDRITKALNYPMQSLQMIGGLATNYGNLSRISKGSSSSSGQSFNFDIGKSKSRSFGKSNSENISKSKSRSFGKSNAFDIGNSFSNSFSYNPTPAVGFLARLMGI